MVINDWQEPVGSIAVLATVLQFLSGTLVCKQYYVNKTTSETSSLPFLCGFMSCTLWFEYGMFKHDNKIMLVNTIGAVFSLAYAAVFYKFTIKKTAVLRQFVAAITFLGIITTYSCIETDNNLLQKRLGLSACCLTLLFVAAPLVKLVHVLKVQSTDCLPFPMIVMTFIVSILWLLYGVITEDPFLQIPNLIGSVLSAVQLSLFVLYPSRPPPSKSLLA